MSEYTLGIDLGTRNSCVSIWRNNKFEIIPDQYGHRTIPSIVSYYRSAKLVGNNASTMKDIDPLNTIYDIKRIIGRRYDEECVQDFIKTVQYKLEHDKSCHKNIRIKLSNKANHKKNIRPEEICAAILIELKKMACNYLNQPVNRAVITVPAYFNDLQRQSTLDAAMIAGLDVIKIINEPTAAALAYGMGDRNWGKSNGGNVIMYDLGAGTLDVSLMNISEGVFRTLAVSGNTNLGGEDIDNILINSIINDYNKKHNTHKLTIDKLAMIRLKKSVENTKIILSNVKNTILHVENFHAGKDLTMKISRKYVEEACVNFFKMCIQPLSDVLKSAGLTKNDIDDIILVGGSTRIPRLRELILNFFSGTKIKNLTCSLCPDEVVSAGASIYGYVMTHNEDPFTNNIILLDIVPLSLGVETMQNKMAVVIPRNTVIPASKTMVFSTDTDYQSSVSIKIFEGERKLTKHNLHLATFDLSGFESAPSGYPKIKITFKIDTNGILQVTASEKRSGIQNSINITSTWGAKGRLSKKEIKKIIQEAADNDHLDTIYAMKSGLIHKIKQTCSSIKYNMRQDISKADKNQAEKIIKRTLKWLNQEDIDMLRIDKLKERLNKLTNICAPLITSPDSLDDLQGVSIAKKMGVSIDECDENDVEENFNSNVNEDASKNEISGMKKSISELCHNIVSIVNNPVCNFSEEDIEHINDYIATVEIWLYTHQSNITIDYISKIDEINNYTDKIMSKYHNTDVFTSKDNFSIKDELKLTCSTLSKSIASNYFSFDKDNMTKLKKCIDDTLSWLETHQNETDQVYRDRLNTVSTLSNTIYDTTSTIQYEDEDDSESSEENVTTVKAIPINEDLDEMITSMRGDKCNRGNKGDRVLLKVDMDKLNPLELNYRKNIESV